MIEGVDYHTLDILSVEHFDNDEGRIIMKFKEFVSWSSDRAADGCWSLAIAINCTNIIDAIYEEPFWRREKIWKNKYESDVVNNIVNPINNLITANNSL